MEKFQAQSGSGVNRVLGFSPNGETEVLDYFKDRFENNPIDPKEKIKTPEQLVFIERINKQMKPFMEKYGISSLDISPDNIHILDKDKFSEEELDQLHTVLGTENGFYSAAKQGVAILKEYNDSKLSFLQTLVHEIVHLQGFNSFQKTTDKDSELDLHKDAGTNDSLKTRRIGFTIVSNDGKTEYFKFLNEAITTELAIRFEREYMSSWPEISEDLALRAEFINEVIENEGASPEEVVDTVAAVTEKTDNGYNWKTFSYHDERIDLDKTLNQLYLKNKGTFKSKEEVFTLFATAAMTGKILPVARLIEHTFGKGSFRAGGIKSGEVLD